jgi:hypothetical protein
MGLIQDFIKTAVAALHLPPYASPCTGDCNQGRDCTCVIPEDDDNYDNPNWPFPKGTKP